MNCKINAFKLQVLFLKKRSYILYKLKILIQNCLNFKITFKSIVTNQYYINNIKMLSLFYSKYSICFIDKRSRDTMVVFIAIGKE